MSRARPARRAPPAERRAAPERPGRGAGAGSRSRAVGWARGVRAAGALLAAGLLAACGESTPAPAEPAPPRHLVLISLDTLRADRLGCYGHDRDTSPQLDAFAARSVQFLNATSAANDTTPSHMSMLTGVLPPVHGQFNLEMKDGKAPDLVVLPATIPLLAERLGDAGFRTVAFTDGGYLTRELQFDRGFDEFHRNPETVDRKVDRVLARLAELDPEQPTFLFVHTYEVHAPYVPPEAHDLWSDPDYDGPWRAKLETLRGQARRGGVAGAEGFLPRPRDATEAGRRFLSDLYDGGVHFTDAEIGRLLDALDQPPWRDTTAVLVVSDHGEAFGEHRAYSHRELYQAVTHVPFLLHVPGGPVGVVETNVSGVDVTPTVLDLLGLPAPAITDGVSVLEHLDPGRPILSFHGPPADGGGTSLRLGSDKLLRNLERAPWQRYDLATDPGEQDPQGVDDATGAALLDRLRHETDALERAAALLREGVAAERGELSPETIESLRALGYLGEGDG